MSVPRRKTARKPAPTTDPDATSAASARRALWTGTVGFGLVSIPVSLYSAARPAGLDLDYLDRRDFAPVGYQRVNKASGKVVEWSDIVKGYKRGNQYVVLGDEDFRLANPRMARTIAIEQFVDADAIPPYFFDTPYWMAPARRAEKPYALLRETLAAKDRIALARVMIRTRASIAAIVPVGNALLLDTLRFTDAIRPASGLSLPAAGKAAAGLTARELAMAERFVDELTEPFDPASFRDTYRRDLLRRIEAKVKAGETHVIPDRAEDDEEAAPADNVVDLMELLRQSLDQGAPKRRGTRKPRGRPATQKRAA